MTEANVPIEELLAEREWLAALARRLVADSGAADDLVQETWATALARPPAERRGLRGWLATVLRSRAHDARARAASEARRAERSTPAAAPDDPAEVVARAELEQRVARLTLALPEPYRATLLLRFHRGLSPKEIAARLGEPAGTVRSRLSRGLDMLRGRLDRDRHGDRHAWVLALLPLAAKAPPTGGTLMLTAPMKAAILVVALAAAGSGAAVLLAEPKEDPKPPPKIADAPPPAPAPPQEKPGAKADAKPEKEDPLAARTDADFDEAGLDSVLAFVTDRTGVRFEVDPAINLHGERSTVTIRVSAISFRNLLQLITTLKGYALEERDDGSILIKPREQEPRPAQPAPPRPWFGSPHGLFAAPPPAAGPLGAPRIELPEADMAEPLSAATDAITIRVSADGTPFLGESPAEEYRLWLELRGAPDRAVLVRADARAPVGAFMRIRSLAGREVRLVVGGERSLPLKPARFRRDTPGISVTLLPRPADKGTTSPEELYRRIWKIWRGNEGRSLWLSGVLHRAAKMSHLAVLLNEAERFGLPIGVGTLHDSAAGVGGLRFSVEPAGGAAVSEEAPPALQPGVVLGRRPEVDAEPPVAPRPPWNSIVAGRPGHRNLRAEGGGASTQTAVDLGLAWLAARQRADGTWEGGAGDTALAVLALLAAGETDRRGEYRETVAAGLAALEKEGGAGGPAAIAFAEVYALTDDPHWCDVARAAAVRTRSGLARRIARLCGVGGPEPDPVPSGTTPVLCLVRILDGEVPWQSESLAEAMNAFIEPTKDDDAALLGADDDFLLDGTLAAFQAGGDAWRQWNRAMKRALVDSQVRTGEEAGSWEPREGGDRVRTTALRTATLTVYYRYARLFKR